MVIKAGAITVEGTCLAQEVWTLIVSLYYGV